MSYNFMSNISNFSEITDQNKSFTEINENTTIEFYNRDNIKQKASFLMIRAEYNNDLLIELLPSNYCVYIPAGEMWSVDSIGEIDNFIVRKIFDSTGSPISTGKLQWMIGYK